VTIPQHLCTAALPLLTLHTASALGALTVGATARRAHLEPAPSQGETPADDTYPRPAP
jgi:hypothetical protein